MDTSSPDFVLCLLSAQIKVNGTGLSTWELARLPVTTSYHALLFVWPTEGLGPDKGSHG